MLVKNWMSQTVVTVSSAAPLTQASELLAAHRIRMLPVVDDQRLVGVITAGDLQRAAAGLCDKDPAAACVKSRMHTAPITVAPDFTIEETAQLLLAHKISGVPVVVASGALVGVITQTDLFKVLIALTGAGERGVQFAFLLENRPGSIKEIVEIIRDYGGRIVSLLTSYRDVPAGYRKVYLRFYGLNRERLIYFRESLADNVTLLYMIDHRENRRYIYV